MNGVRTSLHLKQLAWWHVSKDFLSSFLGVFFYFVKRDEKSKANEATLFARKLNVLQTMIAAARLHRESTYVCNSRSFAAHYFPQPSALEKETIFKMKKVTHSPQSFDSSNVCFNDAFWTHYGWDIPHCPVCSVPYLSLINVKSIKPICFT